MLQPMSDHGRYTMMVPRFRPASGPALVSPAEVIASTVAIIHNAFLIFIFVRSIGIFGFFPKLMTPTSCWHRHHRYLARSRPPSRVSGLPFSHIHHGGGSQDFGDGVQVHHLFCPNGPQTFGPGRSCAI